MVVVLYTDASTRPLLKESQVAWVAKASDGSEACGFSLVDFTMNISQLEMKAIEEGLQQVKFHYPNVRCIHVKSDNQPAVIVMNISTAKSKSMNKVKNRIERYIYNKLKCRVT
jgi:ribonuclease HI